SWRLTSVGSTYLERSASGNTDGVRRIVVFDIPERERKKRDTLRLELMAAGFMPLQKSVWCGGRPLPQDFLELIDALRLRPYVHVFSVRASGTLRTE
ncbi:MAG: hypothetical protein Q8S13_03210, partial [Dehalococcoidia bacterium]|nr:hypothetical protein [Dehalococcoidia bacterium]